MCKDICIPEKGELDLVARRSPRRSRAIDNALAGAASSARAAMLPVAARGLEVRVRDRRGKALALRMTPPAGAARPRRSLFFPERELLIEPAAPQKVAREGGALVIEMKLAEPPPADVTLGDGVAVSERGWPGIAARKAIAVDAPVVATCACAAGRAGASSRADAGSRRQRARRARSSRSWAASC